MGSVRGRAGAVAVAAPDNREVRSSIGRPAALVHLVDRFLRTPRRAWVEAPGYVAGVSAWLAAHDREVPHATAPHVLPRCDYAKHRAAPMCCPGKSQICRTIDQFIISSSTQRACRVFGWAR